MKLSVIIPVYNVESYLVSTLESILQQKQDNLEIILIDDGSLDQSGKICDNYAMQYPEKILVYHIKNGGVSNARNFGLTKASGEYIHFMDADDVINEGMYACFKQMAEKTLPDVIVCGCKRINIINGKETLANAEKDIELTDSSEIANYLNNLESEHKRWLLDYIWNKWYRRELLMNKKILFDTKLTLGEDFKFNCEIFSMSEKIAIFKEHFYTYYIRSTGLVAAFQPEPWVTRQIVHNAHINLYNTLGILEKNINAIKLEDGMLAFSAFRGINNPRCNLSKADKKKYIQNFRESEQMSIMNYYLLNSPKYMHKVWYFCIKYFGYIGIRMVLLADKIDKVLRE